MPNAYLQKVSDEQNIALTKLEEYWNKAKEIAKKNKDVTGEAYWKYVMGIFKNSLRNSNLKASNSGANNYEKGVVERVRISLSRKEYTTIIYVGIRPRKIK